VLISGRDGLWAATVGRAVLIVLSAVAAVACAVFVTPAGAVLAVAYGGPGVYLIFRRPTNSLGWWLTVIAAGLALGSINVTADLAELQSGRLDGLGAATAWAYGWGWSLVMLGLLGVALVYPGGRLPAGRGRDASLIAIGTGVLLALLMAAGPTLMVLPAGALDEVAVPNPLALSLGPWFRSLVPPPDALFSLMSLVALAGLIWMIARFRRSAGLERLQFRWLVAAVGVVVAGTAAWVMTYPAIPIAIAVAVLRYRLYEIDRIISRTISYAVVTGVLVAVFALAVIALQAVLAAFTQGETLAVAASTLVALALFQPLRGRVQSVIDRRFDRSRYDGERIVSGFADRLRDQVDFRTVTADLDGTVRRAVAPTHVVVWVRRPLDPGSPSTPQAVS
jgi:hypothetical protein